MLIISLVPGLLVGASIKALGQQKFEGIATYKSSMNVSTLNVVGRSMNPDMQESVRKQLMQQSQRNYTLTLNLQESTWIEYTNIQFLHPVVYFQRSQSKNFSSE